jgi:hypothetical protein
MRFIIRVIGLLWGLLALLGMLLAFIPFWGAVNWLNIPFAVVGLVWSVIAYAISPAGKRGAATVGIVLCAAAAGLGLIRLILGGGVV